MNPSPESTDQKLESLKVEDEIEEAPKYGLLRRLSQKKEQFFLKFPSAFSLVMICITLAQLFVQIFDVLTDSMISNYFYFSGIFPYFELVLF